MAKLFVLVALSLLACTFAQTLYGVARDFTPQTSPDFEFAVTGSRSGDITAFLDQDQKPSLAQSSNLYTSKASFQNWFRDTAGQNIDIGINVALTNNNGVFSYSSSAFFPIDGLGFGNYASTGHNFHFTTEWVVTFTYQSGQYFNVTAENFGVVFINGLLAIDLSGNHAAASAGVFLDDIADELSLQQGSDYDIRFFHAQRNTPSSHFGIATNIQLTSSAPSGGIPNPTPGRAAYMCEVLYPNFCPGQPVNGNSRAASCPSDPYFTFNNQKYAFSGFNAISFGDFNASTGDVQGRVAAERNFKASAGYSVGNNTQNTGVNAIDTVYPYALVVGGNANWADGNVLPDGSNTPIPGIVENIYVGGVFSTQSQYSFAGRVSQNQGNLDASFASAQDYYKALSDAWANSPYGTQASYNVQYGTINVVCTGNSAAYYVNVAVADFNKITSWNTSLCNPSAQLVFNVQGSGTVNFKGNNLENPAPEQVIYNINGPSAVKVQTGVHGTILAPLAAYSQSGGVVTGDVIVASLVKSAGSQINRLYCAPVSTPPNPPADLHLCPGFEEQCQGLEFPLAGGVFSFRDFNVISFLDYNASTGDIEGRLAAARDVYLGYGYSIGAELVTANNQPDNILPYALVAGRDVFWGSGAIFPDGSNVKSTGPAEGIFAGNNLTAPSYITNITGDCNGIPECLQQYFSAAQNCYASYQNALSGNADNVEQEVKWSGLFVTCDDINATTYYVTITGQTFSEITYYSISNCNLQAAWFINIPGSDDVTISGDYFPGVPGGITYNFLGNGRTLYVSAVSGHILAPFNSIQQDTGVIIGKVVAGNVIGAQQINKQNTCPDSGNITLVTAVSARSASSSISVESDGDLRKGDLVETDDGQSAYITDVSADGKTISLDRSMSVNAGSKIQAEVSNRSGRVALKNSNTSSNGESSENAAASAQICLFAILAVFALLF